MVPTENGVDKEEIQEELEPGRPSVSMKLGDYIPIYIPAIEDGLFDEPRHERRFLDFLRARPSKDWLLKFRFRKSSPGLPRNASPADESAPPSDPAPRRGRRFRVPFVRKINWGALARYCKNWIKHPANIALFIWAITVIVGLIMFFLVSIGLLNHEIPSKSIRKRWVEVINQIINALFTIMSLYQHPYLFHHLVLLCRWTSIDRVEIRKLYCRDSAPRPYERSQMMFVVILFHIACFSQYIMCGLYWGLTSNTRPDWAINLCIVVGTAAPIIGGVYMLASPLGKKRAIESETDQESQRQMSTATRPMRRQLSLYNGRVVVTDPEWIGGLFDCWDDPTVAYCSFFCTFCVFGWNMERLGFGNMYVHIFTFILLCIAPFLIFGASALNISDSTIAYTVVILGAVLCLCGFLYGGYWRTQMRRKFKLPANPFFFGYPSATDCMNWLFCWSCALAQEVRTGNFYDIEDASFYRKATDADGRSVLIPLPREGDSYSRSRSLPSNIKLTDTLSSSEGSRDVSPGFSITLERASTFSKVHAMTPPIPPLIQLED